MRGDPEKITQLVENLRDGEGPGLVDVGDVDHFGRTGQQVFVWERAGWPHIEVVQSSGHTSVSTVIRLLPDEARGIAKALNDAADATEEHNDSASLFGSTPGEADDGR